MTLLQISLMSLFYLFLFLNAVHKKMTIWSSANCSMCVPPYIQWLFYFLAYSADVLYVLLFFMHSKIKSFIKTSQKKHSSAYSTFFFSLLFCFVLFRFISLFHLCDAGKAKVTDYFSRISQKNFGSDIYWLVKYCPMKVSEPSL